MTVARELADFEGRWRFDRSVTDGGLPAASVQGHAEWAARGSELVYTETGLLSIEGQPPIQATRRYVWRDGLRVHFEDGRFFHQVPAQGGATLHECPPDTYRVWYDFANWPRFQAVWDVTGPRKGYRMVTLYWPDQKR